MTSITKITGFIIKRSNLAEADKLLTVFSREHGKIILTAKGVRRIKSRRAPHLELFNLTSLSIHKNIITEAKIINDYAVIKKDLKTVGYLYYIFEIINKIVPENEPHTNIFDLVLGFLNMPVTQEAVKNLMIKIMWDLGYLPYGEYPKVSVTDFLESIAERRIHSKRLLEKIG